MKNFRRAYLAIRAALLAGVVSAVGASQSFGQVLNPKSYISPSGRFELFVDPTSKDGFGPASYRLTRDGQIAWEADKPFSLWDAAVTDQGGVLGYAYEGGAESNMHGWSYRSLRILILASDGSILQRDSMDKHGGGVEVEPGSFWGDSPRINGIFFDPVRDRFVVRVPLAGYESPGDEGFPEVWWTYEASTGKQAGDLVPEFPSLKSGFRYSLFAEPLPDTPFVLVHWSQYAFGREADSTTGREADSTSAVLTLLDAKGRQVWRFDISGEHGRGSPTWIVRRDLTRAHLAQITMLKRGFEVRSFAEASRLTFAFEEDLDSEWGWRQRGDVRRRKDDLAAELEARLTPDVKTIELEKLGVIDLLTQGERSPIGSINQFTVDSEGNFAILRIGPDRKSIRFVRVSPNGSVLTDAILDLPEDEHTSFPLAAHVANDRWVLLRGSYGSSSTKAWWLDGRSGELTPVGPFNEPGRVESLTATGDGGFVVHVVHRLDYTSGDEISRYDSTGVLIWSHREPGYGQGRDFEEVRWIDGVGVAASSYIPSSIEIFDQQGQHTRTIALEKLGDEEDPYGFSMVAVDRSGNLILNTSENPNVLHRVSVHGSLLSSVELDLPRGQSIRFGADLVPDSKGGMWGTDGYGLLHIDSEGVVDRVVGPERDEEDLDRIGDMVVSSRGEIHAVNKRTQKVHVFDSRGIPLRICQASPADLTSNGRLGTPLLDGDGRVYFKRGGVSRAGSFGFDPDGSRRPFDFAAEGKQYGEWLFKPDRLDRWVLIDNNISLVDANGYVIKTITRRPDNDWLDGVYGADVALDGSLAVVSGHFQLTYAEPGSLCLFDSSGYPLKTIPLVESDVHSNVRYGREFVITCDYESVYFYDPRGSVPMKFTPDAVGEARDEWLLYLSPNRDELWLYAYGLGKIVRYRLP